MSAAEQEPEQNKNIEERHRPQSTLLKSPPSGEVCTRATPEPIEEIVRICPLNHLSRHQLNRKSTTRAAASVTSSKLPQLNRKQNRSSSQASPQNRNSQERRTIPPTSTVSARRNCRSRSHRKSCPWRPRLPRIKEVGSHRNPKDQSNNPPSLKWVFEEDVEDESLNEAILPAERFQLRSRTARHRTGPEQEPLQAPPTMKSTNPNPSKLRNSPRVRDGHALEMIEEPVVPLGELR